VSDRLHRRTGPSSLRAIVAAIVEAISARSMVVLKRLAAVPGQLACLWSIASLGEHAGELRRTHDT